MEIATKGQLLLLPWGHQLAQPNLLMGDDATSSLMFIQAANRLCCSHEGN